MRVINMPAARENRPLRGRYDEEAGVMLVYVNDEKGTGWRVCEITYSNPAAIAYDVALAMERARNIGYTQAQADMRAALGIKG